MYVKLKSFEREGKNIIQKSLDLSELKVSTTEILKDIYSHIDMIEIHYEEKKCNAP